MGTLSVEWLCHDQPFGVSVQEIFDKAVAAFCDRKTGLAKIVGDILERDFVIRVLLGA